MESSAQERFKVPYKKIKWRINIDSIYFENTRDIFEFYETTYNIFERRFSHPEAVAKEITIDDSSFYCLFIPFGFGESWFLIRIYKQEEGLWKKVVNIDVQENHYITAEYDPHKKAIVFYTLDFLFYKHTKEFNNSNKVEEIGEISIDDL
jgi:hypothetical protein